MKRSKVTAYLSIFQTQRIHNIDYRDDVRIIQFTSKPQDKTPNDNQLTRRRRAAYSKKAKALRLESENYIRIAIAFSLSHNKYIPLK